MGTHESTESSAGEASSLDQAKARMQEFRQRMGGPGGVWGHPGFGIGPGAPGEAPGPGPRMPPPWGFAPPPPPPGWGVPPVPDPSAAPPQGMPVGSLAQGLGTLIRLGIEALNSGLQALVGQPGAYAPQGPGGCHEWAPQARMPHHGTYGCCSCCMYSQQGCCTPGVSSCG
jgi:hypothetical protein